MKFKPVYNVTPVNSKEVDIMLYGVIGESWFGDGNPANLFVSDFRRLENVYSRINIHINGPGGSVWDGMPMFNVIRQSKADTHTYNDGTAFSMSGIILFAGKTVHAAKTSLLMIHNVSGGVIGNAKDMRKAADLMDKHDELLGQTIADKTGKTLDEVKQLWMNYDDNFLTATEAKALGLIDIIEDYEAKDIPKDAQNMSLKDVFNWYKGEPDQPEKSLFNVFNQPIIMDALSKLKNSLSKVFPKASTVVPLTNEQVNQFNEQLKAEGYDQQVTLVQNSVLEEANNAASKLPQLNNKVTELTNQITDKDKTIGEKDTEIANLNEKVKGLEAKLNAPAVPPTTTPAAASTEVIPGTQPVTAYEKTSADLEAERIIAERKKQ